MRIFGIEVDKMSNIYDEMKAKNAQSSAKRARVNLYTDPDTKEKLQTIADYEGRSLNQQINKALTEWLESFEMQAACTVEQPEAAADPEDEEAAQLFAAGRIDWAGVGARDPEEIGL